MTNHPLRLACAALAILISQALPVAAQERPGVALVLIGPKNDNSWRWPPIARSKRRPPRAAGRRSPNRSPTLMWSSA